MPRIKKRAVKQRRRWGHDEELFVEAGFVFDPKHPWWDFRCFPKDDFPADVLADLAGAWEHFREPVMAEWDYRCFAGERPFAWWFFDAPADYDPRAKKAEQLERWGLLRDDELESLRSRARGVLNDVYHPPFRREWGWWRFLSPERRDKTVPEAIQLVKLANVLSKREAYILQHGADWEHGGIGCTPEMRRTLSYLDLTPRERAFLKLPAIAE